MSQTNSNIGFNTILEDIFGLNIRGLRTITAMFIRPKSVIAAAKTDDWQGLYTPSVRVVFFLLTAMSLLRFVWFSEDSALFQGAVEELRAAEPDTSGTDDQVERLNTLIGAYLAIFPFTYILAQVIASFFVRIWGKDTKFTERLRIHLAVVIPGVTFSVASVIAVPVFAFVDVSEGSSGSTMFSVISFVILFGIDAATASRVAAAQSFFAAFGKGLLFAITATVAGLIGALGANLLAQLALNGPFAP